MPTAILLDNDILLKVCCYSIGGELLSCTTIDGVRPATLATARYVIRDRIRRSRHLFNRPAANDAFTQLAEQLSFLDPSQEEVALAAEFEEKARSNLLDLDVGESLLLAILVARKERLLLTGDKRAICAIEAITADESGFDGHVACFEQLILMVIRNSDLHSLRAKICREPSADRAMSICFSCGETTVLIASVIDGLTSYVNFVRSDAQRSLLPSGDLSALAS